MVVLLGVIVGLLIPPTGLRIYEVSHRGHASRFAYPTSNARRFRENHHRINEVLF
jgi:hypothetical protein